MAQSGVHRVSVGLMGALLAAMLVAGPAAATTPTTEVFTLLQGDHTWSASGAFTDAGTWHTYRPLGGGLASPVAFAGTLFITLTGAEGTINLRLFVEFNQIQERDLCTVTAGTGAYARLAGQGHGLRLGGGRRPS